MHCGINAPGPLVLLRRRLPRRMQPSFRSSWIFLAANLIRTPAVCAWLSRLSLDHIQFFRFDLINSILSPGQAVPRETGDRIERETRF